MRNLRKLVLTLIALSFVCILAPVSEQKEVVLWSEQSIDGPLQSSKLLYFCEELRSWQLGGVSQFGLGQEIADSGDFSPHATEVEVSDILLTVGYEIDRESPSDYWGLFSTGDVNDGIRIEMNRDLSVALLVEAPEIGQNAFQSMSLTPIASVSSNYQEVRVSLDLMSRPGVLQSSNSRIELPILREQSCSNSSVGVGFSDDRSFPGTVIVSVSAVEETSFKAFKGIAERLLPLLIILFMVLEIFDTWWSGRQREK